MRNLEDKLQEACVTWFRLQYPGVIIFAIPNGGSRNEIEAAKLKRTGTLAGVADLFVMKDKYTSIEIDDKTVGNPILNYMTIEHGLFVELKVGKNQQTPAQKVFQEKAEYAGFKYQVCRSIEEFMNVVNEYMMP